MFAVGQQIGSYRIVRLLGAGGMGAVYEAVHREIGRRVAIKVLHPQFALDAQIATRFLNEARATSAIEHPGIVEISEFNRLPDGTTYLVMELLRGESLRSMLNRIGKLPVPEALRLCRQIASPLVAAHRKGIVHRDLKPDNVMLIPDPEVIGGMRVKIVDFGIAKLQNPGTEGPRQMTRTGALMGTPSYMAPEQCRGAGLVDARADVYALGVILYQCVIGRLPFIAEGLGEIMAMHILTAPTPLQQVDATIPLGLSHLVHAMLAKRPEARPTMAQVVEHLESLGAGRPTQPQDDVLQPRTTPRVETAASPSTLGQAAGYLSVPSARRGRRLWVALPGGLLLAALCGGGLHMYQSRGAHLAPAAVTATGSQAPRRVRWVITSIPAGAQVIRAQDQVVLGTTPWQEDRPPFASTTTLVLRHEGFAAKELVLANDRDLSLREQLQALPQVADAPKPEPQVKPRPKPEKPTSRKPRNDDDAAVQFLPD